MAPRLAARLLALRVAVLTAVLLAPVAAAPGQAREYPSEAWSTLSLDGAGLFVDAAVTDGVRGYLYLTAHDTEAIARVRLSDHSYDGTIRLDAGYHVVTSALDPSSDYAYFALGNEDGSKGQIMRLSLADGTISGTLDLTHEDGIAVSAVVDAMGAYAYFGTNTQPGKVIQVRRSDFVRTATLEFEPGEDDLRAAAIDSAAGYAYFGTRTQPGRIVRVRLSDFMRDDALTLSAGDDFLISGVADPAAGYAYFGTYTEPGRIVRLSMVDFAHAGTLTLADHGYVLTAVLDSGSAAPSEYIYFGTGDDAPDWGGINTSGRFVRVRQSDFAQSGSLQLDYEGYIRAVAIYAGRAILGANRYACYPRDMYCVWFPGEVARIALTDFEVVDRRRLGESLVTGIVMADDYLYADTVTGQIVKIQLDSFTREASVNLPFENDVLHRALLAPSGEYAYIARDISPAEVLKVRLSDLAVVGSLTFADGENGSRSVTTDAEREFAYFGTGAGQIVKVRLADLTRVDALSLGSIAFCGGVDSSTSNAYFGLGDGRAARVRLSDFTVLDFLQLSDVQLGACIVDSAGGYAYFGHDHLNQGGYDGMDVERVRLADFTPSGSVHLRYIHWYFGDKHPNEAVLDPNSGISYWTSWGTACNDFGYLCWLVGAVDMVRLEDFTAVSWMELNGYPWSIVLDEQRSLAYFGIISTPGAVQRIGLDAHADVSVAGAADPRALLPGQALTYTLTVTSMGPHAATGVALTATLPSGLTFLAASPNCAPAGMLVQCALPDLRAAASRAVTVTVLADPLMPAGAFTTTVQAGAQQPDGILGNNVAVVTTTLVLPGMLLPLCGVGF